MKKKMTIKEIELRAKVEDQKKQLIEALNEFKKDTQKKAILGVGIFFSTIILLAIFRKKKEKIIIESNKKKVQNAIIQPIVNELKNIALKKSTSVIQSQLTKIISKYLNK